MREKKHGRCQQKEGKRERKEGDIPATRDTFMVLVVPWNNLTFVIVNSPP
jgi:hypothetical protein